MGSTKSTTKVENKALERVIDDFRGHYAPGGEWKASPQIDPTSPENQARADQLVAPRSQDTLDAHNIVRQGVGSWQPGLGQAKDAITSSLGPIGAKTNYSGAGWSSNPDGSKSFDQGTAYGQLYNQYTDQVLGNTLTRLQEQYGKDKIASNDAMMKAGAFGGSRHGIADVGLGDKYLQNVAETSASAYQQAHESALTRAAESFTQGQGAQAYNAGIDATNAANQLAGGKALGDITKLEGEFRAGDVRALGALGADNEAYDQSRRDAVVNESNRRFFEVADLLGRLGGMTAPLQTQTTTQSGGMGSMIGGALLQGLGAMFSDEDAKTKKREIDPEEALKQLRKLRSYEYEYTDDAKSHGAPDGRRVGFMAQDLERATGRPSVEMPGGYKGVDMADQMGRLTHAVIAIDRKLQAALGKHKAA